MQVYLTTLGCRLNEAEIEALSRRFGEAGHRVVTTPDQAQLMVINTCAVTTEAARKSRKLVTGLHRSNPSARLVVTGCYAALEPERAAALTGVDRVIDNHDKERLVELVLAEADTHAMPVMASEPEGSHVYARRGRTRAFVKVQDGCRNRCTFCIVTVARGDERSRTSEELVDELQALRRDGYREAVLTGVHLGGYGAELGTDLYGLVETLIERTDMPRLRLSSLEPWDLPPHFWRLWQSERLMPHLHLPLQSGSDAVLRRMGRRCNKRDFRALTDAARAAIEGLTITTDIIVGFPGETDAEWRETVDFVKEIGFGHVHVFSYSARQGTRAATLSGQLPGPVKRDRSRELHGIAERMKQARLVRCVGETRSVLWETRTTAPGGDHARWVGYSDNYLRVQTPCTGVDLENRITSASLVRLGETGDRLWAAVTP